MRYLFQDFFPFISETNKCIICFRFFPQISLTKIEHIQKCPTGICEASFAYFERKTRLSCAPLKEAQNQSFGLERKPYHK